GHEPDKGEWDIPGGFVELEESFPGAARRELEEETGVKFNGKIELLDTLEFHRGDDVVGVVFHAELEERPEIEAGEEALEAKFWKLEELEESGEKLRELCRPVFQEL
ncbi:MAG: NUDIX hydrolase, partial [Candidatus Nanohaloarchaea archaeon]